MTTTRFTLTSGVALCVLLGIHTVAGQATQRDLYKLPDDFLFGGGTGSYQSEGAWNVDGKTENIYDWSYHLKGRVAGDIAADAYHRFEEDIRLSKEMNMTTYRFSLAWPRILPNGYNQSAVNQPGIDHYNKVINTCIKYGLTPMVTIYHFDHPQTVENVTGGWIKDNIIDVYVNFAKLAFDTFGDRVKHWITLNEPNQYCALTYGVDEKWTLPPGDRMPNLTDADVYRCIHNQIRAHTRAYHYYQKKYENNPKEKGLVGFGPVFFFAKPYSSDYVDTAAAEQANMFDVGMVVHPLVHGEYPPELRKIVDKLNEPSDLPRFTAEDKKFLQNLPVVDFIAVNAYYGMMVADKTKAQMENIPPAYPLYIRGPRATNGVWEVDDSGKEGFQGDFVKVDDWNLRDAALWLHRHYDLPIFITENGYGLRDENTLDDYHTRGAYLSAYLRSLMWAVNVYHVKVIGYTYWALIDDFEWSADYSRRFGLVHVDYDGGSLNRTLKTSSKFIQEMMATRSVPLVEPLPSSTVEPLPSSTVEPLPSSTVEPLPSSTVEPLPSSTVKPLPSGTSSIDRAASSVTILVLALLSMLRLC